MPELGDCEQRPGRKAATWGVEVGPGMNKGRAGRNYRDLAFSVRFTMKFFLERLRLGRKLQRGGLVRLERNGKLEELQLIGGCGRRGIGAAHRIKKRLNTK